MVECPKFWLAAVVEQWKMAPTRPETPEHGCRTQLGNDRNPEKMFCSDETFYPQLTALSETYGFKNGGDGWVSLIDGC